MGNASFHALLRSVIGRFGECMYCRFGTTVECTCYFNFGTAKERP